MQLPKVLIIGQPFNNNSGGGITQANLFAGWDKDKVAVVCTDHMFNNLNPGICDTYYVLGSEEYKWSFPFNLLQRKVSSGVRKVNENTGTHTAACHRSHYPVNCVHGLMRITPTWCMHRHQPVNPFCFAAWCMII